MFQFWFVGMFDKAYGNLINYFDYLRASLTQIFAWITYQFFLLDDLTMCCLSELIRQTIVT